MSWSYSGDPASSALDRVRFLVGDTDEEDQKISDEEALWLITEEVSPYRAAALACESIAAKYAALMDKTVGSLSLRYSQKTQSYLLLGRTLYQRSQSKSASGAIPFYGNKGASNPTESGVIRLDGMTNPGYRVDAKNDPRGV